MIGETGKVMFMCDFWAKVDVIENVKNTSPGNVGSIFWEQPDSKLSGML